MKRKIIWDFRVKKCDKETTNIHSIDFKNGTITWYYMTDEKHVDRLMDVELYAYLDKVGYVKVTNGREHESNKDN